MRGGAATKMAKSTAPYGRGSESEGGEGQRRKGTEKQILKSVKNNKTFADSNAEATQRSFRGVRKDRPLTVLPGPAKAGPSSEERSHRFRV